MTDFIKGRHITQVTNQASCRPFQTGHGMSEATLALEQRQSSTIQAVNIWGVARRVGRQAMDSYLRAEKTLKQWGNER
jgi:hypothetical protein